MSLYILCYLQYQDTSNDIGMFLCADTSSTSEPDSLLAPHEQELF